MKPGFFNYYLVHVFPWIAPLVGGLICLVAAIQLCRPNFASPHDDWLIAQTLVGFVAAYLVGMIFGALYGAIIITIPLRSLAIKMNGGPFAVGDHVLIMVGPHKGKVGPIYELWQQRGSVRVFLGEEEKKKFEDVINEFQVWRVREGREGNQT